MFTAPIEIWWLSVFYSLYLYFDVLILDHEQLLGLFGESKSA